MSNNQLPTDYQAFIALSRYARWLPEENRRETFGETVTRYITEVVLGPIKNDTWDEDNEQDLRISLEEAILSLCRPCGL